MLCICAVSIFFKYCCDFFVEIYEWLKGEIFVISNRLYGVLFEIVMCKQNVDFDKKIKTYTEKLKRIIKYESIAKQAVENLKKQLVEAEKNLNDKRIEKIKCSKERGEFIEKKMNVMKMMYACEISDDEDEKTLLIAKETEKKTIDCR